MPLSANAFDSAQPVTLAGNPELLPEVTEHASLHVPRSAPWPEDLFTEIHIPADLAGAVPLRRLQFRAGRFCALTALRRLCPELSGHCPGRSDRGAPLWPSGVVGSITHTDGFVSAAVALSSQLRGVGIDSERVMSNQRADAVSTRVAWAAETATARSAGLDRLQALTMVFSAKESIFKCLHPLTGVMFFHHDVRIESVDMTTRRFRARLLESLTPDFPSDTMLEGRFDLDESLVHTAVWLSTEPGSAC